VVDGHCGLHYEFISYLALLVEKFATLGDSPLVGCDDHMP
jgi:hypothetical protein